jgi:hypothetical protein
MPNSPGFFGLGNAMLDESAQHVVGEVIHHSKQPLFSEMADVVTRGVLTAA